jgi:hypothetical protein
VQRAFIAALAGLLLAPLPARAHQFSDNVEVFGYGQFWLTAYEQMERVGGVRQNPSQDFGTDHTTGLSIARARLGARLFSPEYMLGLYAQTRLDRDGGLLDLVARFAPGPWFALELGQMKIPSTRENLSDDRELDFILRTTISNSLADYALARSRFTESLLAGAASQARDLGLAVKGEIPISLVCLRYFFMLGNGLGANLFIGGDTRREFVLTNGPRFFYGGRLEVADALDIARLGVFGSYNKHDDMVLNSGRAVYDLDRLAGAVDVRLAIPGTGVSLTGLLGGGRIREDFDGDGRDDLRYSGWASALVWNLIPLLVRLGAPEPALTRALELGFRFDAYYSDVDETGQSEREYNWTVGATYRLVEHLKLQLNYVARRSSDPRNPDFANDILFASVLLTF